MKRVVIALAVIAGSASALAQARIPIGVITVKDKGFIDPQDVGSRRDIEREMRRCCDRQSRTSAEGTSLPKGAPIRT